MANDFARAPMNVNGVRFDIPLASRGPGRSCQFLRQGRGGSPAFLAPDDSGWLTGETLGVGGG